MEKQSPSSLGKPGEKNANGKPVAEKYHPELTRLPEMTRSRLFFRRLLRGLCRFILWAVTRSQVTGLENIPSAGPVIMVFNHLGDADAVVGIASIPVEVIAMAKMELYDYPLLGKVMDAYGCIWVHRGLPDRRALRAAIQGLEQGCFIGLAPEGRESVTGELEEGTGGAAYLAIKSGAPLLPVTFTGTENANIFGHLKRFRRAPVSMTAGPVFELDNLPDRKEAIELGTQKIMRKLAEQLPPEYRGIYREDVE